MKICFICDLHLPEQKNALQYSVLNWAIDDMKKKDTDCVIFAGDATCNGNKAVYDYFWNTLENCGIPFISIPGNSDLRNPEYCDEIKNISSCCENTIGNQKVYAVNDCDGSISDEIFDILEKVCEDDIVFMHHPVDALLKKSKEKFSEWRKRNSNVLVFCGHNHISMQKDNEIYLQAADPDKAIGENPCITYFDTETRKIRKAYYFSPPPTDLYDYFGISCYNTAEQIEFATKNNLKYLELRPNCIKTDKKLLSDLINKWRCSGGVGLYIHMPDICFEQDKVFYESGADELLLLVNELGADGITQHVPKISVGESNKNNLEKICDFLCDKFSVINNNIIIGIENMHMTSDEKDDTKRRFGYTPYECSEFIALMSEKTEHNVGFKFDIGHARNNAPFSSTYQIGTWMAILGKQIVGYHMHQVACNEGVFENHMPITDVYGTLISYSSFFRNWTEGNINKTPIIFEMRGDKSYEITLNTFDVYKNRKVFDIHSHTYYSNCGRDSLDALIHTAVSNGISLLGISDHAHGIGERKGEYIKEIGEYSIKYKDVITVLKGIEINTLPMYFDINKAYEIEPFDYCLLECITDEESLVGDDLIGFCKKIDTVCGIAHTDLFEYCKIYNYDPLEYFTLMAQNDIFWEMNVTYDSIHHYNEHQYVKEFMDDKVKQDIVKKSGLAVSIGLDSHRCEDYDGFKAHNMYSFLKENNINTADEIIVKK